MKTVAVRRIQTGNSLLNFFLNIQYSFCLCMSINSAMALCAIYFHPHSTKSTIHFSNIINPKIFTIIHYTKEETTQAERNTNMLQNGYGYGLVRNVQIMYRFERNACAPYRIQPKTQEMFHITHNSSQNTTNHKLFELQSLCPSYTNMKSQTLRHY